jgi:Flagellar and Swarming motility proteins
MKSVRALIVDDSADLIKFVEQNPDTVITLVNGEKILGPGTGWRSCLPSCGIPAPADGWRRDSGAHQAAGTYATRKPNHERE